MNPIMCPCYKCKVAKVIPYIERVTECRIKQEQDTCRMLKALRKKVAKKARRVVLALMVCRKEIPDSCVNDAIEAAVEDICDM